MIEIRLMKKDNEKELKDVGDILSNFYFISINDLKPHISRIFVAEDTTTKKIIGALQLNKKMDKINLVVVKEAWRREGIGKRLFEEAIKVYNLKKLNCVATLWPGNSTLFWNSIGFKPTGEITQTKKGNWMLEMCWENKIQDKVKEEYVDGDELSCVKCDKFVDNLNDKLYCFECEEEEK